MSRQATRKPMAINKCVASAVLASMLSMALPNQSFAIMACGNNWQPVFNGIGSFWGLSDFTPGSAAPLVQSTFTGRLPQPTVGYFVSTIGGGPSFTPADYAFDCNSVVLQPASTSSYVDYSGGQAHTVTTQTPAVYACVIQKAPKVDMAFVSNLQANGFKTSISYPFKDPGTGTAIVSWAKVSTGFNVACPSGQTGYDFDGNPIPNSCAVNNIGVAYVTGAGWQNQFTSSPLSGEVANLPAAYRDTAAIVGIWGPHPSASDGDCPNQFSNAAPIVMIGSYPPGQPDPSVSLPAIPPYVPAGDPSAINVGGVSNGGGSGAGTGVAGLDRNAIQFNYSAYCALPGPNGQPRSPAWVKSCMAGH